MHPLAIASVGLQAGILPLWGFGIVYRESRPERPNPSATIESIQIRFYIFTITVFTSV